MAFSPCLEKSLSSAHKRLPRSACYASPAVVRQSCFTRSPCLCAITRMPSCLISCSHKGPEGGRGAVIGKHGGRNIGQPDPEITGSAAAPPTRRTTTASSDETMANATAEAQIGLSNANRGRRSAMCVLSARNALAGASAAVPRSAIMTIPSVGNG
jgi:hypothetical protein